MGSPFPGIRLLMLPYTPFHTGTGASQTPKISFMANVLNDMSPITNAATVIAMPAVVAVSFLQIQAMSQVMHLNLSFLWEC